MAFRDYCMVIDKGNNFQHQNKLNWVEFVKKFCNSVITVSDFSAIICLKQ